MNEGMKLIMPKKFVDSATIQQNPLFYLLGPVLGADNWQEACCLELAKCLPSFYAVVPCNWKFGSTPLYKHFVDGATLRFLDQTAWEYYYLKLANQLSVTHRGCIISWLPKENQERPRVDGRPYGIETHRDISRWFKDVALRSGHMAVGGELGFPGLRDIKRGLELDLDLPERDEYPICSTLAETVIEAVQWVNI